MLKKFLGIVALIALVVVPAGSAFAVGQHIGNTEVLIHDEARTYNAYTLFPGGTYLSGPYATADQDSYAAWMIDIKGNIVKRWDYRENPGMTFLQEDGLVISRNTPLDGGDVVQPIRVRFGGSGGIIMEMDKNNNEVTRIEWYAPNYWAHHDQQKIWNKALGEFTYIALEWIPKGAADATALGVDTVKFALTQPQDWSPDGLVEFDSDGNVIWRWTFADHIATTDPQGTASAVDFPDVIGRTNSPALVVADVATAPEKLDINVLTVPNVHDEGPELDWNHCNSFDYNANLGHIAVNAKHQNEFYVIDHDGTFVSTTDAQANIDAARGAGGDFLYRYGQPSNYNQGTPAEWRHNRDMQFSACHDIQWIRNYAWGDNMYPGVPQGPALPGGGNFLIFDNNTWNPIASASSVVEINPYILDDTGATSPNYVNPPDAGYTSLPVRTRAISRWNTSNQQVWRYWPVQLHTFWSRYISGNTRLPNGNTFINAGAVGQFFQVDNDSLDTVWEYKNPLGDEGPVTRITDNTMATFSVFRAYPYSPDHPGIQALGTLVPLGTFTGRVPQSETGEQQEAYTGFGFSGLGIGGGGGSGGAGGGGTGGY
jgi:hypothetical protein